MSCRYKHWLGVLGALLVLSACGEDTPLPRSSCPPLCTTPGAVQTGDSGAGMIGTVTVPDAGGSVTPITAPPASRPQGTGDAGSTMPPSVGLADSGNVVPLDAASNPGDAGGAPEGGTVADAGMGANPMQALPAITDYAKPGPFKTATQANVGPSNNYTIYRPEPLGAMGFLHSPIIFGPGILTDAGMYSALLTHLASHGFVTICVNSMGGGPGDPGNLSAMKTGLDWLISQNTMSGIYQGKLAVDRAIGMGYSIGATASVELSSHKAIATTVVIHGHNTKGDPHGPVLMITGTNDVIDDMRKTLSTLEEAPAVLVALPIGHLDVLDELAMLTTITAKARYIAPITAWLRYWINGDQEAKKFFAGSDCAMCKSPWITPEPNAKWKALMF